MLYQLSYAREGRIVAVPGVSTTSRGWLRSEATTAKASRGRTHDQAYRAYSLSRAPATFGASNATSIATQKLDRFI